MQVREKVQQLIDAGFDPHTRISELRTTTRTFNCLRQNVVITFMDLAEYTDQQLLYFPNFGLKCLADLMTSLEDYETKSVRHDVYIWVNDNIGLVKAIMDASIHEPVLLLPFKGEAR